jgi:hypothetical protein
VLKYKKLPNGKVDGQEICNLDLVSSPLSRPMMIAALLLCGKWSRLAPGLVR